MSGSSSVGATNAFREPRTALRLKSVPRWVISTFPGSASVWPTVWRQPLPRRGRRTLALLGWATDACIYRTDVYPG